MIKSGELKARIQIERDVITSVSGAEVRVPEVLYEAWAKPEALSGGEAFRAQQVTAEVDWRFTVRYEWRGKIRTSDRIIWRGAGYEIKAVIPDETYRDSMALMCRSTSNG